MQLNMNTFKVLLAFIVAIGAIFWAVDSVRSQSYSETDLNFAVGGGTVSVTNPSDEAIPAQLIGARSRTFQVSSTIDGVSGSSTRQSDTSGITQLFEFELPPGTSEFTVTNGLEVNFVAESDTELEATMNPQSSTNRRNILVGAVVVVIGALYYASSTTGHQWMNTMRGIETVAEETKPTGLVKEPTQEAARTYGDNRTG